MSDDYEFFQAKIDKKILSYEQWCKIKTKFWSKINMINLNKFPGSFPVPIVSNREGYVRNRGPSDG